MANFAIGPNKLRNASIKLKNIFSHVLGAHRDDSFNHFIEMVLLCTHNICFGLAIR